MFNSTDIKDFENQINKRLSKSIFDLNEDTIRYLFLETILFNANLNQIFLEYKYINICNSTTNLINDKCKLDAYITKGNENLAIEFKYHRELQSKKNVDGTMYAGEIFNDFCKLSCIDRNDINKYLIYIVTDEMYNYFYQPRAKNSLCKEFRSFITMKKGDEISLIDCLNAKSCNKFVETSNKSISKGKHNIFISNNVKTKIICRYVNISLNANHRLYIYEVKK